MCHFPPGTSKWNRVEHRLFAAISTNWRGRPLVSHEIIVNLIVNLIAAATNASGLSVHAELDRGAYPTGTEVTQAEIDALDITSHDFHGEWNYTIHPRRRRKSMKP